MIAYTAMEVKLPGHRSCNKQSCTFEEHCVNNTCKIDWNLQHHVKHYGTNVSVTS